MNANELANLITDFEICKGSDFYKAATMLRQQQAEIEALKSQYKFGVDWGKDDKSVTVVKIHEDGVAEIVFVDYQERTHPAKTLTDEEINELGNEVWRQDPLLFDWMYFARAILKKVQEK